MTGIRYEAAADGQEQRASEVPFRQEGRVLETPHYVLEWNGNGQLSRVFDLDYRREVLAKDARGNVLQVFEDKPLHFEAWDVDIFYQEKMREITELVSAELVEIGPLAATMKFQWRYASSVITQRMTVYAAAAGLISGRKSTGRSISNC